MKYVIDIFIFLAAVEQFFIMFLEMFFMKSKSAKSAFNVDEELLKKKEVRIMFANQGLYNGFLAAGLVWSIFTTTVEIKLFFLVCVIIAAIYGAFTVDKKILFKQGGLSILSVLLIVISFFY